MGTTVREVIDQVGGGVAAGRTLGFAAVGGPSSGILPPPSWMCRCAPEILHPSGVVMGAGGITVFDDQASPAQVAARLAAYNAAESCGKMHPLPRRDSRIAAALQRIASGGETGSDRSDYKTWPK